MDREIVNNIKSLGIDMIDKAGSGHPGIVLGAASIIYTLYAKHMNVNPNDPLWENRDRFVLSAGHGSALLYATLYMAGFNLTIDDLKQFRHIHSKTPGHPEYGITDGVDMSTGPLGQGIASAVGMALAGKILNKKYEIPKKSKLGKEQSLFDYNVYVLCGDGDLMEGISYEATSLAGSLKLNNLIVLYDSNNVSLDGKTDNVFEDNIIERFKALNWNTIQVKDGTIISSIDKAIEEAKKSDKPTLIEIKTIIGEGSIYENTNKVHGTPLDKDDITKIKLKLKIEPEEFYVNNEARNNFIQQIMERSLKKYELFNKQVEDFNYHKEDIRIDLGNLLFDYSLKESLRVSNGKIMQEIAKKVPNFIGGSADVGSSTKAVLPNTLNKFIGNNINFGVREHAMGAILNGLALNNFYTFGSTFLVFSDYLKPAIRMSALMNLPVTYIFTHDSISVGEDGRTHEPVEQLTSLRVVPNLEVFRPADANEVLGVYKTIFEKESGPSAIALSRNKLPILETTKINEVSKGGYIVYDTERKPSGIIIATGEEVHLAIEVAKHLQTKGLSIRVVSMPCIKRFESQNQEYIDNVLPVEVRKIVIEAASSMSWNSIIFNKKYLITLDKYGASGTKEDIYKKFGFDIDSLEEKVENLLK